jgi:hypothetical protein
MTAAARPPTFYAKLSSISLLFFSRNTFSLFLSSILVRKMFKKIILFRSFPFQKQKKFKFLKILNKIKSAHACHKTKPVISHIIC